jgi:pimeloyl-ACP methyl ester carboxylesterase
MKALAEYWTERYDWREPQSVSAISRACRGLRHSLPREIVTGDPPRHVLERNYNLVHYTKMPRGGHFAFWEQPELMVADVRQFFRTPRS